MAMFWTCPFCGDNLDPGEKCESCEEKKRQADYFKRHLVKQKGTGQLAFRLDYEQQRRKAI